MSDDRHLAAPLRPADDEYNRQLVANVHPPGWENPKATGRYHLVVVGGGTAGLVAAAGAAGLGARVALIERHLMGGDCLNTGCVPSKALLRSARAWHAIVTGRQRFAGPDHLGGGDFAAAMRRMRQIRAQLSWVDGAPRFQGLGVDVFLGTGSFGSGDTLRVGDQTLRFRRALVATGARPVAPPIPGLAEAGYLTNETVFGLTELPRRLAVVGGGPIGCELAQAFARFGSYVTLFDVAPQILPREDADAAALVARSLERDGVHLELGTKLLDVSPRGRDGSERLIRFERKGQVHEFVANQILVATGRQPNVEGLDLEKAGVRYSPAGVQVDDRLRTTNPKIFAAGDVCSTYQFTHNADAQARVVVQNALFPKQAKASTLIMPWCTFTSPEVAHVGLYEQEARDRGIPIETRTMPLREVDRAVLDGEDDGFLRLHLRKGTDRILGASLVAENAGDMASALCLAVAQGIGLERIARTVHPYPTQGEVLKKAADAWRRTRLTPGVKRMLKLWFWWTR